MTIFVVIKDVVNKDVVTFSDVLEVSVRDLFQTGRLFELVE